MTESLAELPELVVAHLRLSLVALVLGTLASLPLGIVVARRPRLAALVLGVVGVIQTVPSLALLAIMVPTLAALGPILLPLVGAAPPAIGAFPATIALTIYGMLPILRNAVAGLRGIDPAILEAADGVGMTPRERLWRVELPLAAPVIVAGLRTATVWVVGTATLATPIGATSLGNLIFAGLQTRNVSAILVGCAAAAVLAITLDAVVARFEHRLERRGPTHRLRPIAAALALLGAAWLAFATSGTAGAVRIAAKPFTEQAILAEILAGQIRRSTGESSRVLSSLGSTVVFDGLAAGSIDVAVDYSGTLWTTILRRTDPPPGRKEMIATIADLLAREHGIAVVGALGFENAYALAMRRDAAGALAATDASSLRAHAPRLSIGADYEFFSRPEWRTLEQTYGFAFRERRTMDPSLLYEAVAAQAVDVIAAYSSDGRIATLDLVVLEDDRRAIPPYDALVLVSKRFAREHGAAVEGLRSLLGRIDVATMRELNASVDGGKKRPAAAAAGFLDQLERRAASSSSSGS